MVSSVFQIVIGFSGVIGLVMRFIGPLVITPTLMMIGLSLFEVAADHAGAQWGMAIL